VARHRLEREQRAGDIDVEDAIEYRSRSISTIGAAVKIAGVVDENVDPPKWPRAFRSRRSMLSCCETSM
jgi:hypothetical protein